MKINSAQPEAKSRPGRRTRPADHRPALRGAWHRQRTLRSEPSASVSEFVDLGAVGPGHRGDHRRMRTPPGLPREEHGGNAGSQDHPKSYARSPIDLSQTSLFPVARVAASSLAPQSFMRSVASGGPCTMNGAPIETRQKAAQSKDSAAI